ncbi:MAG: carbohydrate-binding domain-containing protein, partial [Anaerolineaceae bacterium]|nr:carbohydrate-binding domain-containing protein [Anaerolineaceae bacterium]
MKKISLFLLLLIAVVCSAAAVNADDTVHRIILNAGMASLDGADVPEYDYIWHADPDKVHDEVKNAPAEYYTGTKPSGEDAVYIAYDIFYFPEMPESGFKKVQYDGDQVWAYYYPVSEYKDYIWGLLPAENDEIPVDMMHNEMEALENPVLHITKAGTYEISGTWEGQIWIDLGENAFTDENAKVTLILNGVDVTCTVAPALVFYSVYEADNAWEQRGEPASDIDISNAGARVVITDNTVNNFSGTNVPRMLKASYKEENSTDEVRIQNKMRKTDGAFYSFRSMVIDGGQAGTGVLNILSSYEGLNSELHLTINGGKISIQAQNDGLNANEDNVSVVTINGGELHIAGGLGNEGDGIDSNGYVIINGGVVISAAKPISDSGLDSDLGSFINGGMVVATGSIMNGAAADSEQVTMNLQFVQDREPDEAIIVTDKDGHVVFAYDPDKDETAGSNNRKYRGAVLSSPEFKVGETYYVYTGGDVQGNETNGLYDINTVTGFSGAVRQTYNTSAKGGPGGGPEGGPDGMDGGTDGGMGGPGGGM